MKALKRSKIVVTIPAHNEEATIGLVISDVKRVLDREKHGYEVVVIDDGSTDRTAEVARKAGATVFSHPYRYGLAETFRTEMKKVLELKADVIVHIDADRQYRAEEMPKLLKPILDGQADLVLGSRFMGTIESMPLMKRLGNKAFSRTISKIVGVNVTDCQTGFRAFTREVAEKVRITSDHTYTQEMIIRAVGEKFRIREVPVYFAKRADKSRLMSGPFEYALKAWLNLFRIYRDYDPIRFFGFIGGGMISAGVLLGLTVVYSYMLTGKVGRTPTLILTFLLVVVGVQLLLFGFTADKEREKRAATSG